MWWSLVFVDFMLWWFLTLVLVYFLSKYILTRWDLSQIIRICYLLGSLWDWRACSLVFYKAFVGAWVLCDHKRKERYMASVLLDAAHWGQNLTEVIFEFLTVSSLSGSKISNCHEAKCWNANNCLAIHNNKNESKWFVPWIHNGFESMKFWIYRHYKLQ